MKKPGKQLMVKKVLFPLISIFLAYRSYELLKMIGTLEPAELSFWIKLLLSFLLNLFATGIFAFAGFAYKTNKLLPESYYRINNKELVNKLSTFLKIEYFRKFLLVLFWGKRKNRQKYFDGTKSGLKHLDYQTRQSEFGHLSALVLIQLIVVMIFIKEHYLISFLTTMINFVLNFYPVLLQRKHRIQIERILNRVG